MGGVFIFVLGVVCWGCGVGIFRWGDGEERREIRERREGRKEMGTDLSLIGVGHAVSDIVFRVADDFLLAHGLNKGAMTLIDESRAEALLRAAEESGVACGMVAGGSVANSLWGVGALERGRERGKKNESENESESEREKESKISAGLWARLGGDELAKFYESALAEVGVALYAECGDKTEAGLVSGRCLVFITPDSERTMATCLGIAGALCGRAQAGVSFSRARLVYLEGYLWDAEGGVRALGEAVRCGRAAGAKIAFSLSDAFCVARHRDDFLSFIRGDEGGGVDILFANAYEAGLLAGAEVGEGEAVGEAQVLEWLEVLGGLAPEVVITNGAQGAYVRETTERETRGAGQVARLRISAEVPPEVRDLTGAGDFFAAGYLYGRLTGQSAGASGVYGARAAAAVLGGAGARPTGDIGAFSAQVLRAFPDAREAGVASFSRIAS